MQQRFPWVAWTVSSLLLAALVAGLGYFWWTREPPLVERQLPRPPQAEAGPELVARAAQLERLAASLESRLDALLGEIAAPMCPAPRRLDPELHRTLLTREGENITRWQAVLRAEPEAVAPVPDRASPRHGRGEVATGAGSVDDAAPAGEAAPEVGPPTSDPDRRPEDRVAFLPATELSARLEQATAFVLVQRRDGGVGTGTAFFIADGLLVTNRHVVQGAAADGVLITSRALGRPVPTTVLATSVDEGPGSPDFALLRVEPGVARSTLPLSDQRHKLADVTAAGYPGVDLRMDEGFRRLVSGDMSAAPDLHMSSGEIRSIQPFREVTRIVHTADVLKGYSGGPLVDACGRVVGVNTFIQVDREQASKRSNALDMADLTAFLAEQGVAAPVDRRRCHSGVQ